MFPPNFDAGRYFMTDDPREDNESDLPPEHDDEVDELEAQPGFDDEWLEAAQKSLFDGIGNVPAFGIDLTIPSNVVIRDSEFPDRDIILPDETAGVIAVLENAVREMREMVEKTGITDKESQS
jgi:hypothetical protein